MSTSEQQMQQLVDQVQMLTAELAAQRLELDAAKNALDQQTQTATAALSVAQAAIAQIGKTETQKKTLNPKLVNPPDPFQGTDADWERYKFGFATWISTVDPTYPDLLRKAELERDEVATVEMTEADEQLSTNLFAILVGQCQAGEIPAMAMLVPERNGLELWRRMHARFEPENKHKPFAWLRALSNPTFPTKETLWQRGLEEWEGEIAKYEREYTKQFDEDLKLAILTEVAPKALAPQIAMNSSNLTSYKLMREFIVQYLKSKNLWKRSAGTSFGSMAASSTSSAAHTSGPVPMEVGALDAADPAAKQKGKSTGHKGNQNGKGGNKGGTKGDGKGKDKGRGKQNPSKSNAKGEYCAICGPEKGKNHSTENCFFNARSHPKGEGKGNKKGSAKSNSVNAIDAANDETPVPAVLSTLQQQIDALKQVTANQGQAGNPQPPSAQNKKTHQGAVTSSGSNMCFAVGDSPAKAVEKTKVQPVTPSPHNSVAALQTTKYIMVDSGATTSCANKMSFPQAAVDPTKTKELWAINGTPIHHEGEMQATTQVTATTPFGETTVVPATFRMEITDTMEPVMAFCRILDDADCDLHFFRSSSGKVSCLVTPDGNTVELPRFGSRFYLPYEDRPSAAAASAAQLVAAVGDMESDVGDREIRADDASVDGEVVEPTVEPQSLPQPPTPTDEARQLHELTHADFAPWCQHCVAGKAPEDKHVRTNKHEDAQIPVIQIDYQFFSRDGELVEEESRSATVLTGVDTSSGFPVMIFARQKGVDAYVLKALMVWITRLGYNKVLLQHDPEEPLRALLEQVQQKLGADKVQLRASPRYSHQSQGGVEGMNRMMAGMLRTWLCALREKYPHPNQPLDINHIIVPWLCKWVAFVWARYHIKNDNVTAYKIVTGREYTSPIVQFGEVVMCKVPNVKSVSKSKPRWFKGIFAGRTEADDSAIVLTNAGAMTVRSIRRLPQPEQHDVGLLDGARGLPWALTAATRAKIKTETSQVVPMLPPTAPSDGNSDDDSNASDSDPSANSTSETSPGDDNDDHAIAIMPSQELNMRLAAENVPVPSSVVPTPTTPMLTPQGMTPPESVSPPGMTPPVTPVEIPLSDGGSQHEQIEGEPTASPIAVPLPKREIGDEPSSPTKVPRVEVPETRAPT